MIMNAIAGAIGGLVVGLSGYYQALKENKEEFDIKKFGTTIIASTIIGIALGFGGVNDVLSVAGLSATIETVVKRLLS